MPDDRLLKKLMLGIVEVNRQRRRPVRRWIDDILMWCGQDIQGAVKITEDRDNWRRFVASSYSPCWPRDSRRRYEKSTHEQNLKFSHKKAHRNKILNLRVRKAHINKIANHRTRKALRHEISDFRVKKRLDTKAQIFAWAAAAAATVVVVVVVVGPLWSFIYQLTNAMDTNMGCIQKDNNTIKQQQRVCTYD